MLSFAYCDSPLSTIYEVVKLMKAGKLKESVFKRSVLKQLHKRTQNVIAGPAVGSDYGAVSVTEDLAVVLSSDPVTLTKDAIGSTAVLAACKEILD